MKIRLMLAKIPKGCCLSAGCNGIRVCRGSVSIIVSRANLDRHRPPSSVKQRLFFLATVLGAVVGGGVVLGEGSTCGYGITALTITIHCTAIGHSTVLDYIFIGNINNINNMIQYN